MSAYSAVYRTLLARLDAEQIHDLTVTALAGLGAVAPALDAVRLTCGPQKQLAGAGMQVSAFGLTLPHPLGLAAGFDKNAHCFPALHAMGFSSVEVGTITPRPQPGSPRPRIFRLVEDQALINRMGLPGEGMDAAASNLSHYHGSRQGIIGISLGKNKDTPLADAHRDYGDVLTRLYPYADFFAVNVSSPNTPELRKLQTRAYLADLLAALTERADALAAASPSAGVSKPILVKLAPDLTWQEIDTILDLALHYRLGGIIATNTTTNRDGLISANRSETGGLSGKPLQARSTEIIRHCYQAVQKQLCIVGVGGVFSGDDLWEKLTAGATLAQAYTGFIYEGPRFVRNALVRLAAIMRREGVVRLVEIIGIRA